MGEHLNTLSRSEGIIALRFSIDLRVSPLEGELHKHGLMGISLYADLEDIAFHKALSIYVYEFLCRLESELCDLRPQFLWYIEVVLVGPGAIDHLSEVGGLEFLWGHGGAKFLRDLLTCNSALRGHVEELFCMVLAVFEDVLFTGTKYGESIGLDLFNVDDLTIHNKEWCWPRTIEKILHGRCGHHASLPHVFKRSSLCRLRVKGEGTVLFLKPWWRPGEEPDDPVCYTVCPWVFLVVAMTVKAGICTKCLFCWLHAMCV